MASARLRLASFATPSTSVKLDADTVVFEVDRLGHPHVLGVGTFGQVCVPSSAGLAWKIGQAGPACLSPTKAVLAKPSLAYDLIEHWHTMGAVHAR